MSNSSHGKKILESSETILAELGRVSQQRRETLGLSISQLCKRTNISSDDLELFEAGKLDIDIVSFHAMAKGIDTTAANILVEAEGECATRSHRS